MKILTKDKFIVEKMETRYFLKKGEFEIFALIWKDGRITLKTDQESEEFVFVGSDPEVVAAIGELIVEASKIKK